MPSKYRNVPTVVDNLKFDSLAEARRYGELKLLLRAGLIRDLRLQVRHQLLPAVRFHGSKRQTPGLDYVSDFEYFDVEKGAEVCEDSKGARTRVYLMKKHMMKALLGMEIFESRARK